MPSLSSPQTGADPDRPASRRYHIHGHALDAKPLDAGLHIVATPIGNLEDVTIRALATLAAADVVLAEDTRVTGRLLNHYGISARMLPYHEHNAREMRPRVLALLAEGKAVAQVSDAGTPLVSDPGFRLVAEAVAAGHKVTAVPGPSAVLAALVAAALPTDRFFFEGFLPPKSGARRNRLAVIAAVPATLVVFESGHRVAGTLADMREVLGDRPAAVARELTKMFEEIRRGSLGELAAALAAEEDPRGEIVLIVGPPPEPEAPAEADLDALLAAALERLSVKDAAAEVAAATGQPKREVYQRALALTAAARGR